MELLADQVGGRKMLFGIAPQTVAYSRVEHFGEALREAVGQRFQEDVIIIVNGLLKALEVRLESVNADGKPADPILSVRIDKIRKAQVCPALAFLHLLAKEGQARPVIAGEHEHVVTLALAAPKTDRRLGRNPAFGNDLVEHRIGVLEQTARTLSDDRIFKDRGVGAGQLPRAKKGRPVDRSLQV